MIDAGSLSRPIRVLIADDHAVVRAGLRRILELEPDLQVVGEAVDGAEAVEKACETQADVVLMDVSMPRVNGLEATRLLRVRAPASRVVALTIHTDDQYVVEMARAGAWGYLIKDEDPGAVVTAIRRVAQGEVYISAKLVGSLVRALRERPPETPWTPAAEETAAVYGPVTGASAPQDQEQHGIEVGTAAGGDAASVPAPEQPSWPQLTGREVEVLSLIAHGRTNRQIAEALVVSEKTVKNHVTSILRKLRLKDRTQAAIWAIRSGWIP